MILQDWYPDWGLKGSRDIHCPWHNSLRIYSSRCHILQLFLAANHDSSISHAEQQDPEENKSMGCIRQAPSGWSNSQRWARFEGETGGANLEFPEEKRLEIWVYTYLYLMRGSGSISTGRRNLLPETETSVLVLGGREIANCTASSLEGCDGQITKCLGHIKCGFCLYGPLEQIQHTTALYPWYSSTSKGHPTRQAFKDPFGKVLFGVCVRPADGNNTEIQTKVFMWILLQGDSSPAVKWCREVSIGSRIRQYSTYGDFCNSWASPFRLSTLWWTCIQLPSKSSNIYG